MYSKKMSVSSAIPIALLVFCAVNQASALKCYTCESFSNGACWTDPQSGNTQICNTDRYSQMLESSAFINATTRTAIASIISDDGVVPSISSQADCAKFVGMYAGQKYIAKMCTVKSISCEFYKSYLETKVGFRVESCDRCNGDFCNSSNNLNSAVTILVISTILIHVFQL